MVVIRHYSQVAKKAVRNKDKVRPKKKTVCDTSEEKKYYYIPKFKIYDGFRWPVPSGSKLTESQISKFQSLDTCKNTRELFSKLNTNIHCNRFEFPLNKTVEEWNPPMIIKSILTSIKQKRANEWKKIKNIYIKLVKFKNIVTKIEKIRLPYISLKNLKNTEDLVTMEIPRKAVVFLDLSGRCSYIFEASTIRKVIENRILLCDYMFSLSMSPVNPYTNAPLTRGQLFSIIHQCKMHGEFSWIMDRLWNCECDFELFLLKFKQPIKLLAIENFFKGNVNKYRETVIDYFESIAYAEDMPSEKMRAFSRVFNTHADSPIIYDWIKLTRRYYIATELRDITDLASISRDSDTLLKRTYIVL